MYDKSSVSVFCLFVYMIIRSSRLTVWSHFLLALTLRFSISVVVFLHLPTLMFVFVFARRRRCARYPPRLMISPSCVVTFRHLQRTMRVFMTLR